MCSFNSLNGVPGCANKDTETDILKKEWGFDGFIESDYTAVAETRACPPKNPDEGPCGHGTAADGPEAGANALMAGTDSEMVSTNIRDNGEQLLAQGKITMAPARRRRTPDPARQVPRRPVRAPLRRPGQGGRPGLVRHRGRPGSRPQGCVPLDGAAEERRATHAAARPDEEDRRDRPARRRPARHARPVVGQGRGRRRRQRLRRASRPSRPARRSPPGCTLDNLEPPDDTPATSARTDGLRRRGREGQGGRPGRARARRVPRDERRGRVRGPTSTCPASSRS